MTVTITFYYQSVDAGKAGKGGAAANQQEGKPELLISNEGHTMLGIKPKFAPRNRSRHYDAARELALAQCYDQ